MSSEVSLKGSCTCHFEFVISTNLFVDAVLSARVVVQRLCLRSVCGGGRRRQDSAHVRGKVRQVLQLRDGLYLVVSGVPCRLVHCVMRLDVRNFVSRSTTL